MAAEVAGLIPRNRRRRPFTDPQLGAATDRWAGRLGVLKWEHQDVGIEIVFETHSLSEDNERGLATGWLPGRLSQRGRDLACELGKRRRDDDLSAVFTSDLRRAAETAELAFADTPIPVLADWRLRECDYGDLNGAPAEQVHARRQRYLTSPYPGGESWDQAVRRVARFLDDLPTRWADRRVLVIGHVATRWAFDHLLGGCRLQDLMEADFAWQKGWEYRLDAIRARGRG